MTNSSENTQPKGKSCPLCRKARSEDFHPFCSSRCRDRDLNQWFNEGYAVPSRPLFPEEMASAEEASEQEWKNLD